ncbi:carbohydrate-binding domain-containing protein [Mycoplasmatota bacterium]|nr:carbohydrate-binding domain-containing protein [Mycoplasmatota bacterium]
MKKTILLFILISSFLLLTSCSLSLFNSDDTVAQDTSSDLPDDVTTIELPELDDDDQTSTIEAIDSIITFSTSSIEADDDSIMIEDNTVTIDTEGVYELTGSNDQVSIYIDASSDDTITLVLNNVSLSSSTGPIIYIENADKVMINVVAATENTLTDTSLEAYDKDSVIYSKDDLTINGTGSLTINAGFQKGIKANDDLVIYGTTLNITSEGHAIKANNSITISEVDLTINSNSDGIQSDNEDDPTESLIYLISGTYDITSYGDAISSSYDLTIYDGTYDLVSGYQNNNVDSTSAKALKTDHNLYLINGDFNISSEDDAIHSDDGLIIFDGTYTIASEDDAIHTNNSLDIQGGTITITDAFEVIEGKYINISGGNINIIAEDDGINGSDPEISSAVADVPNGTTGSTTTSTAEINISGGTIMVTAEDDAIDANGSITISGGIIVINGPTSGMQSLIDYDIDWILTGGTIIGTSGYGNETKTPSDESTQINLTYNISSTKQSGTSVSLLDENNEIVMSFTPTKSYQVVFMTSAELDQDTNYTLILGGTIDSELENGYYSSGTVSNYQSVASFTLDDINNTFNVSSSSPGGTFTPGRR